MPNFPKYVDPPRRLMDMRDDHFQRGQNDFISGRHVEQRLDSVFDQIQYDAGYSLEAHDWNTRPILDPSGLDPV